MATSAQNPWVVERGRAEQQKVDTEASRCALYYHESSTECIRVLRTIERLRLKIETRNIRNDPGFREQLIRCVGSTEVPCLRVREDDGSMVWLNEPNEIIAELEKRFN